MVILIILASCKADMICSAYQSYFLLDGPTQTKHYSYFAEDSLPRRDLFNPSKDKNGILVYEEYRARWLDHKTVPMEVIYPILSDSALFAGDVMMYAETDVIDSAALDSAMVIASTFQYNVDQKYYNWYFRDKLVWANEVNGKKQSDVDESQEESKLSEPKEKKGLKGMFKKKEKVPREPKVPREKKNKKKKNKSSPVEDETIKIKPESTPTPVKEEEDDGENDF